MIQPYDRTSWERVYHAFLHYIGKHKAHSEAKRLEAGKHLADIKQAVSKDAIEHKQLNSHLAGNSGYSNVRIQLIGADNRQAKILDLSKYVSGKPIQWRYEKPRAA